MQSSQVITILFSFILNCIILTLLMLFSKKTLERIRKIIDILTNGGFKDCPHYFGQRSVGRRWYDCNNLDALPGKEGGESL